MPPKHKAAVHASQPGARVGANAVVVHDVAPNTRNENITIMITDAVVNVRERNVRRSSSARSVRCSTPAIS